MNNSSDHNNANQKNADSEPESEKKSKKSDKSVLSKFYGLYNTLTGVAGVLAVVAGVFIHGILATIFLVIGVILFLFAVHVELDEHVEKPTWFVTPLIGLVLLFGYLFQPKNETIVAPQNSPMRIVPNLPTKDSPINRHDSIPSVERRQPERIAKAYPGFKSLDVTMPLSEGKEFHVEIMIYNFGDAAALDFKCDVHLAILSRAELKDVVPKKYRFVSAPVDLLPKQSIAAGVGYPPSRVTPELLRAVSNEEYSIVLWCVMEYKDEAGRLCRPKPIIRRYFSVLNNFTFPPEP
jgi:hypothetical protein